MRIALTASLAALLLAIPAFTVPALAAAGDAGTQQQPPAKRTAQPAKPAPQSARTGQPTRASQATRASQPAHAAAQPATARSGAARVTQVAHTSRTRGFTHGGESSHPGLGDGGDGTASAGGFCGNMVMPAAALREVSRGFSRGHAGLDLMAPHGSPIKAAAAGTVIYAGWYFAYGNIVDIRHADGVVTRYAHMSAFAPNIGPGTDVQAGEEIGNVGATGRAHGAHVHFEVRVDGRAIDPKPYLGLASCDPANPREEILEAYADERPAAQRRPATRARQQAARTQPQPPPQPARP